MGENISIWPMRSSNARLPEADGKNPGEGKWAIRRLTSKDVDQVVAIERMSFPSPWSEEMVLEELSNPLSSFWVLESGGRILGYLCAWWVKGEVHLLSLATHPDVRRRGVAKRLLVELIEVAKNVGVERIFLEVRESNSIARKLYSSLGFSETGRRPQYYTDTKEDAIVMSLDVGESLAD